MALLRRRRGENNLFFTEIAKELGKSPNSVRWMAKRLGLPSTQKTLKKFGRWNSKHAHLRPDVMRYYLNHSFKETSDHFSLTRSELKSLMTICYRLPEFSQFRKETRTHEPWSKRELVFLLRHAGLRNRTWIAKRIGRGNVQSCIKERLLKLGLGSRNLQGLTLSQFQEAFGIRPAFFLQTDAGPARESAAPTLWKIVPWVWLQAEISERRLLAPRLMRDFVDVHAVFQEWIFGGNALSKMKRIVAKI